MYNLFWLWRTTRIPTTNTPKRTSLKCFDVIRCSWNKLNRHSFTVTITHWCINLMAVYLHDEWCIRCKGHLSCWYAYSRDLHYFVFPFVCMFLYIITMLSWNINKLFCLQLTSNTRIQAMTNHIILHVKMQDCYWLLRGR